MPVAQWLLDILACPVCRTAVTITDDLSGLRCGRCLRLYPIQEDIPIMLVSEAAEGPKEEPA